MSGSSFNPGEALAYFLTWTTYGTRLPGDERGWNRKKESAVQSPSPLLVEAAQARMKEAEFRLSPEQRRTVETTIRDHCSIRNWTLHAVNARSNHVHVVVTAAKYRPETVRDQFKAWCTRKLKSLAGARSRFWTEGGSCRWMNRQDELESALIYVVDAQDRPSD